jgi:hypothetical protein
MSVSCVEIVVVKVTLHITAYMTCALCYTFSMFVKRKNTVQKILTKMYRVTLSLVKTGAVEVTLY